MRLLAVLFSAIEGRRSHEVGRNSEVEVEAREDDRFFQDALMARLTADACDAPTHGPWAQLLLHMVNELGVDRAAIVRPKDGCIYLTVGDHALRMGMHLVVPAHLMNPEHGFVVHPTPGTAWDAAVPLWDGEHLMALLLVDDTMSARDFSTPEMSKLSIYAGTFAHVMKIRLKLKLLSSSTFTGAPLPSMVAPSDEDAWLTLSQAPVSPPPPVRASAAPMRITGSHSLPLMGQAALRRVMLELVSGSAGSVRPWACVMVGLDGMRAINTSVGWEKGNELLDRTAQVLRDRVASGLIVGRWFGDIFLVAGDDADVVNFGGNRRVETLLREAEIAATAGMTRVDANEIARASADRMMPGLLEASWRSALNAMFAAKRAKVGEASLKS